MTTPTKRGLAYPLALVNGGLALATDAELKRGEVISVLQTRPFERVMRPTYGTPDYVFDSVPVPAAVAGQIQSALENQVDGVTFALEGDIDEAGDYGLTVAYAVNGIEQPVIQYVLRS